MIIRRGISLLDLLDLPPGSQALLPASLASQFDRLSIIDHRSTISASAYIHHGTLLADDTLALPLGIQVPGLNTGLPFQLTMFRAAASSSENLEPKSPKIQLDLILSRVAIEFPGLRPARFVDAAGAAPAHLVPDLSRQLVRIVGSGVLRIRSGGGSTDVLFIDRPDPIDAEAPTGAAFGLTFDPPHFYIGNSEFGLTVDRLTYDASDTYTPPEIAARGHDAAWEGIVIKEATFYLPPGAPLLGDISVGVRDVILGKPAGIQGELRIEFGHATLSTFTPQFFQVNADGTETLLPSPTETDRARTVSIPSDSGRIRIRVRLSSGTGRWYPPGEAATEGAGVELSVSRGEVLRVQPLVDGNATAEVLFTFQPTATPASASVAGALTVPAPTIQVTRDVTPASGLAQHNVYHDVASISGAPENLRFLTFSAVRTTGPAVGRIDWRIDGVPNSVTQSETYSSIAASFPSEIGCISQLILTEHATVDGQTIERTRRVLIEVLAEGSLLIGAHDGVHDARSDISNVIIHAPLHTWDLGTFEESGTLVPAEGAITQTGATIAAPRGVLAEVLVDEPSATPTTQPDPNIAQANARRWNFVEMQSGGTSEIAPGATLDAVRDNLMAFTRAKYLVVGRTDDLWVGQPPYMSSQALDNNRDLAQTRATTFAARLRAWLDQSDPPDMQTPPPAAEPRITAVGEQDDAHETENTPDASVPLPQPSTPENPYGLPRAELYSSRPERFLIKRANPTFNGSEGRDIPARIHARRVDIFTIGGELRTASTSGTQPTGEGDRTSALRHVFIPGDDQAQLTPPAQVTRPRDSARTPKYRVRIRVVWDSPTVVSIADAIPTLAEVTVAWSMGQVQLPPAPASGLSSTSPIQVQHGNGTPSTADEIWTLVGQWSTDPRSGETLFSLSLSSTGDPDGLFKVGSVNVSDPRNVVNAVLATGFALGPAIIAGAQTDPGSAGVKITELLLALGVAPLLIKNGKVVFHGFKIVHRQASLTDFERGSFAILVDYSAEVLVDSSAIPLPVNVRTRTRGLRVRYKNVGLIIDHTPADSGPPREWYDRIKVVYDEATFEVENPGDWEISGPLGQLLRVMASRAGNSSTWLELDLVFALDLGVITITGATIRLTLTGSDWSFELRGLGVRVRIENVLVGEGRLQIGEGGDFSASIDVLIVPMKVQARAAMRYQHPDFFFLEVGVLFPTAIPITPAAGVFGFIGRFVMNGARVLTPVPNDPVATELKWYKQTPLLGKYGPSPGQWALGLGAVVGTLPDGGYSFNATGMLVVAFPDPSVIFGIDAFIAKEKELPSGGGTGPGTTAALTGLIVIDPNAITIGIRGQYTIPRTLELRVPIGAHFPFHSSDTDPSFFRIGADNNGTPQRAGDPVTLTLLPGTLGVRAWAYFMVEERQLHQLGGNTSINLDGFSIGMGVGASLEWGSSAVHLSASLSLLIGLGTKPLTLVGALRIRGELRLVCVSISASADLLLMIRDNSGSVLVHVEGELCGKVDFFFFSVSGCVTFSFGDAVGPAPTAPPPLTGIDLVDRRAILMGHTVLDPAPVPQDADIAQNATVWPDTIPVLKFTHFMEQSLPPASPFLPRLAPPVPSSRWWGSDELKYAYRLTDVVLSDDAGVVVGGPLDASWWLPASRPGVAPSVPGDPSPSAHEGRDLALLTWHPALWARNLGPDGDTLPGDPAHTVDQLCNPSPQPARNCALGASATRNGPDSVTFRPKEPTPPPFPNWFEVRGSETQGGAAASQVALLGSAAGQTFIAGTVVPIEISLEQAYRIAHQRRMGRFDATLQFDAVFAPSLENADITLVVCTETASQICDEFSDLQSKTAHGATAFFDSLVHGGLTYASTGGISVSADLVNNQIALRLTQTPFTITLPDPCSTATLFLLNDGGQFKFAVDATNDAGATVDKQVIGAQTGPLQITVNGAGIRKITIHGNRESRLVRVCYTSTRGPVDIKTAPAVFGIDLQENPVPWNVVEVKPIPQTGCAWVRYAPGKEQPWQGLRIGSYKRGRVHIVSICGISSDAAQAARDDQQARSAIAADLTLHSSLPARQTLLDPGKTYRITVKWQSQTWQKSDAQPQPPAIPSAGAWSLEQAVIYRFAVASEAPALPVTPPPALITEDSFDVRGVSRYLLGFAPGDGVGEPHFLDDTVSVHFSVDHLPGLLSKYGRALIIRVVHTNPPAGSRRGVTTAAGLPSTYVIVPSAELLGAADSRLVAAALRAPCIAATPNTGGSRADVAVTLQANSEYDVILVAEKPGADVVIARAHFRTSRYPSPRGLLDALGFTTPNTGPVPFDFMVADPAATLPTGTSLGDDAAFEAALRALGMDPWPVPAEPRVTAVWTGSAGAWRLAAILVESPEPLQRGARLPHVPLFDDAPPSLRVTQATLVAVATTIFAPRFSNGTHTAMLLAPAGPPPASIPTARITLTLATPDTTVTGSCALYASPVEALLEEDV